LTTNSKFSLIKESSAGVISILDLNGAEISRDGLRAVDSGMFTCPSKVSVNVGDVVKFITDVADTTYLRGAYLFQGSCLDESGYNVDPINQTHPTISGFNDYDGVDYEINSTLTSKFYNFYQGKINVSSQGVILNNKTMPNGSPVHDFSGNFDVFCWITTPPLSSSGLQCIYGKSDAISINGSDIGFNLGITKFGNLWAFTVYMKNNSGGSLKSLNSGYIMSSNTTYCIRVKRDQGVTSIWVVSGTESIPFNTPNDSTTTTGNFNSTKQATIGTHASTFTGNNVITTTNRFQGKLHSIRIYCGGVLDDNSASQIFSSRPIPLIMKLAGNVWKIESDLDKKKIFVKGFGKIITDTLVSEDVLTTGTAIGEYYHTGGSRVLTNFTNVYPIEVIRAIFAKLNVVLTNNINFKLSLIDLSGISNNINSYNAKGNLLEIINQLMMITNLSFYISPRGRCIIEIKDIDLSTKLQFNNGMYEITVDGFDDSNTANDLYIYSRASGSFAFVHQKDDISINQIGLYSKRIMVPQLTDGVSVGLFKTNFLNVYKNINRRYTVEAPFILDFIRENFKIKVINTIKNLDSASTIKSLTWKYPDSRTIIETGDYLVDAFDLERVSADTINNIFTDTEING
jgi:hypothetical protein